VANERIAWLEDNPADFNEVIALDTEASFRLNDPDLAITASKTCLAALKPKDTMFGWANNFLGRALSQRRKFREAIPYLKAATEANPGFSDYWVALGSALVYDGEVTSGINTLQRAVDVGASSADNHEVLARAFEAAGDLADSETEYKAASNLDKNSPSRFTALAKIQIKRNELADAKQNVANAVRLNRLELYAYLLNARILDLEGDSDSARSEREKAESLLVEDSQKSHAHDKEFTAVPLALFAVDDPEELIRLEKAHQHNLTAFDRRLLAIAYLSRGRNDQALTELAKDISDSKMNTAGDNFIVAEALHCAGMDDRAEEFYRRAYEMDPENTTYRHEFEALRSSPK
jgi:tetratricopeptide (TPR) repeat protein